jgi:predicted RNA-binding Zn-ribbon protein involved in translation (DUF1610 family)
MKLKCPKCGKEKTAKSKTVQVWGWPVCCGDELRLEYQVVEVSDD